jgi:hypothetical protein
VGVHVPQPNRVVPTGGGQRASVGAERHAAESAGHTAAADSVGVAGQRSAELLLAADDSAPPPLATSAPLAEHVVPCWEARCWAALKPATGVALYDGILRAWPRGQTRDGGLYLARLARACAEAGQLDRARTEGRRALAIARATQSSVATRELRQLTIILSG